MSVDRLEMDEPVMESTKWVVSLRKKLSERDTKLAKAEQTIRNLEMEAEGLRRQLAEYRSREGTR